MCMIATVLKQGRQLLADRVEQSERMGCGAASHEDILRMAFEVTQIFPELIVDPEANPETHDPEDYEGEWLVWGD